jgi:hypothetical protein
VPKTKEPGEETRANAEEDRYMIVTGNRLRTIVLVAAAGLAGIAAVAGCHSERRAELTRVPGKEYLVGGGIMIEWRAPERGTVYLVEERTNKIVETRSMAEGDVYTFAVTSVVQASDYEELLGIKFSRARFLLYFEPAGRELPEQARLTK